MDRIGIEFPAGSTELATLSINIDPQHGGHKFPAVDLNEILACDRHLVALPPIEGHCASSWAHAAHDAIYNLRVMRKLERLPLHGSGPEFCCPKWDVDALCAATMLSEIEDCVYMGTGGSQHYFRWAEGIDGKLDQRIELVRKLDTGELGQQLGDHPELIGLARVAADPSRDLADKIRIARAWLTGLECPELRAEAQKAAQEVAEGLADAVTRPCGGGIVVIHTYTKGQPSRGRGAAQRLGFDRGYSTVIQFSEDWAFPSGEIGPKVTITHKGNLPQAELLRQIKQYLPDEAWGGPTPQPSSWIVGSPQTGPTKAEWPPLVAALARLCARRDAAWCKA